MEIWYRKVQILSHFLAMFFIELKLDIYWYASWKWYRKVLKKY